RDVGQPQKPSPPKTIIFIAVSLQHAGIVFCGKFRMKTPKRPRLTKETGPRPKTGSRFSPLPVKGKPVPGKEKRLSDKAVKRERERERERARTVP
ncbi:MAG: hypothetical protein LBR94_00055, partial [Desulfovibrio sp.]|nr:hypothetical protein [Desulfovibrio sp.]